MIGLFRIFNANSIYPSKKYKINIIHIHRISSSFVLTAKNLIEHFKAHFKDLIETNGSALFTSFLLVEVHLYI